MADPLRATAGRAGLLLRKAAASLSLALPRENRTQLCGTFGRPTGGGRRHSCRIARPQLRPLIPCGITRSVNRLTALSIRQLLRAVLRRQHAITKVLHLI